MSLFGSVLPSAPVLPIHDASETESVKEGLILELQCTLNLACPKVPYATLAHPELRKATTARDNQSHINFCHANIYSAAGRDKEACFPPPYLN